MNLGFFNKVRRNHALEHATITLAHSGMGESGILGGNSMQWGFLVYGDVPTDVLSNAAEDALRRLKSGESDLAVSPYCGTNLVVAATLAAVGCAIAVGKRRRWSSIPRLMSVSLMALLAAKYVGPQVQRYVTTSGEVDGLTIRDVDRIGAGGLTVHRVRTAQDG